MALRHGDRACWARVERSRTKMAAKPATSGGTGLVYVLLLLLVLGGGAVAVWLIVRNGQPKAPAPAPAPPVPAPAPTPNPGDWVLHKASGPYVPMAFGTTKMELPLSPSTQKTDCTPALCKGQQIVPFAPSPTTIFPADITKDFWSYVRWDEPAQACNCGLIQVIPPGPLAWTGTYLPEMCPRSAKLAADGHIQPYDRNDHMYTNYDRLMTVTDAGGYNLCDDYSTTVSR